MSAVLIRPAGPDDARAMARVHIDTRWRAYRGILADRDLAIDTVETSAARWADRLAADSVTRPLIFVSEDAEAGRLVGFVSGGTSRHPSLPFDAEVYALYVGPASQRRGIGRQLVRSMAGALAARAHRSLMVATLAHNVAGRRFYESMGGTAIGSRMLTIGAGTYPEVFYGWRVIEDVIAWTTTDRPG